MWVPDLKEELKKAALDVFSRKEGEYKGADDIFHQLCDVVYELCLDLLYLYSANDA